MKTCAFFLVAFLTVALCEQAATAAELPAANQTIIAFCDRNKGVKVGNGICDTLVHQALHEANARQGPLIYSSNGGKPDASGKGTVDDVLPGDVWSFATPSRVNGAS